jgi:hypothetical protein
MTGLRKTKVLEGLLARLRKANRATVGSGYHGGTHKDSGMSYASLMNLHERGFMINNTIQVDARPVRLLTSRIIMNDKSLWSESVRRFLNGSSTLSNSLNKIGVEVTEVATGMFGDTSRLASTAKKTQRLKGGRDTPLVDSGDLRDHWTWKVKL